MPRTFVSVNELTFRLHHHHHQTTNTALQHGCNLRYTKESNKNEIFTFRLFTFLLFAFPIFTLQIFPFLFLTFFSPFFYSLHFLLSPVSGRLWSLCYRFFDKQNLFRVVGPKETQRAHLYWSWSSCTWWRVHCFHHVVFLALLVSCFFLHCFCRIAFDSFSFCFCRVLFLTLLLLHCFYHASFLALLLLQCFCHVALLLWNCSFVEAYSTPALIYGCVILHCLSFTSLMCFQDIHSVSRLIFRSCHCFCLFRNCEFAFDFILVIYLKYKIYRYK